MHLSIFDGWIDVFNYYYSRVTFTKNNDIISEKNTKIDLIVMLSFDN